MQSQHRDGSDQNYLMGELESLGLSTIRLNELNDNYELHGLVRRIKDEFLRRYENNDSMSDWPAFSDGCGGQENEVSQELQNL
ncbi:MAG TPA: hypothetical protein VGQ03_05135 [Nitrososphaera sp.]|jgi:hypothetical protein|nr:hypothetical protein [Nitrososphaera sp.]